MIENEEAYKSVVRLGCEMGQGWYFVKPMQAEQARELLVGSQRAEDLTRTTAAHG